MGTGRGLIPSGGGGNATVGAWLPTTQFGIRDQFAAVSSVSQLDELYFELPVDYFTSGVGEGGVPSRLHGIDEGGYYDTGIALHLDAAQGVTSASVGGYANPLISQWADQSTHGRHATQSTTVRKPWVVSSYFNGHPTVQFTDTGGAGTDAYLSISGAGAALNPEEYTIFAVISHATNEFSTGPILGNKESGSNKGYNLFGSMDDTCVNSETVRFRTFDSGGGQQNVKMPDNSLTAAGRYQLEVPWVVTMQVSGSSGSQTMTIRQNGLSGETTTSLTLIERTSGDFQIALDAGTSGTDFWTGTIAELVIYSSALSNTDILKNEAYLTNKLQHYAGP